MTALASHQTVRLSRRPGRDRVTVMQLAALLGGERATERPSSVCPVVCAFLGGYAARADEERLRDLYRCASDAVGTNVDFLVERRARACAAVLHDAAPALWPWRRPKPERLLAAGRYETLAALAGRALATLDDVGHRRAMLLFDEMVGMQRYPGTFELPVDAPARVHI